MHGDVVANVDTYVEGDVVHEVAAHWVVHGPIHGYHMGQSRAATWQPGWGQKLVSSEMDELGFKIATGELTIGPQVVLINKYGKYFIYLLTCLLGVEKIAWMRFDPTPSSQQIGSRN